MTSNVYDQIKDNEYTSMTLLEFKKTFDTVKHSDLIKELKYYGIRGVTLDLLTSFLTNRKQYVAHKDNFSNIAINKFGEPQESNLGPLLFLVYINNISNNLSSMPRLFANDTCIIIHQSNQTCSINWRNKSRFSKCTQMDPSKQNCCKSSKIIILSNTSKNNKLYLQHKNKLRQFYYSFTRLCEMTWHCNWFRIKILFAR